MKHLKKFESHTDYETYMGSADKILPNVSFCAEDSEIHINKKEARPTYESVDLGLPSGLKWAKCNIGAETETDYGDYFMWGSVTSDTDNTCDWAHAPFNNGQSDCDSTYFNTHKSEWLTDEGILKPEYDAAHVIMGGYWRMPTREECRELIDNTINEWTTVNGVKGRLFTSKKDSTKTLFIPAAGDHKGSSFSSRGSYCYIRSSSLNTEPYYICNAWLLQSHSAFCNIYNLNRCNGYSVRGVCK